MNINFFMNEAINQARIAFEKDEVPEEYQLIL